LKTKVNFFEVSVHKSYYRQINRWDWNFWPLDVYHHAADYYFVKARFIMCNEFNGI